jgi:internalin A
MNQIRDVTPLAELAQLEQLTLSDNQIHDITPLAELTQLTELRLDQNQIRDIAPLFKLMQLKKLNLEANPIQGMKTSLLGLLEKVPDVELDIEKPTVEK